MINVTENFLKQIESFLLLLTPKERTVIERRYNLDNHEKATLEAIGQKFSVTRERIRQIEKNALNKLRRNLENTPLAKINNVVFEILTQNGGLMKEKKLLTKVITLNPEYKAESLQLILSVDKRYIRVPNTVNFYSYVRLNKFDENFIVKINREAVAVLVKNKNTMTIDEMIKNLNFEISTETSRATLISVLNINKSIIFIEDDSIGLMNWRHINPRTLRDKIFFILRKEKKPMHFVEHANKIIEYKFDKKKINLQAVHNELIRHPNFVLIGRGIYGLKEWGYTSGTVADVISEILKNSDSMTQEEIVKEVLKQRQRLTLPPRGSTISADRFNFSVRYGKR